MPRMRKWIGLLLALAILFRVGLFVFALVRVPLSSDEAWPALMALHILKGEIPVVYWGQSYMGTQESFFDAALIGLFGPTTGIVRLYPLLMSLLFLLFSYQLAARIHRPSAGLIVLVLLAVPVPYLSLCSVLIPPDNYLACATLGSWSLVLLHDLVFRPDALHRTRRFIFLGFLLGFAFWLHILVAGYIGVALLLVFLRDKLCFLRRECWAGALAFVVGALPLLVYNMIHHGATFRDVGQTTSWQHSWELLRAAFEGTLHFLVGAKVMLYGDSAHFVSLPLLLAGAVGLIWLAAILWALLSRLPMFLRLLRLSLQNANGVVLLAAAAGAALFLFCRSSRSGWKDVRYLLPIMSALPVLLAIGLDQIRARSRIAFGVLLGVLLAGQVWGNVVLVRAWRDPRIVGVDLELPDSRPLHRFLAAQGITRVYAHYWIAYRCTYEARERIIFGEPYNERFPRRANDVKFKPELDAATNVAYVAHPTLRFFNGDFDELLKNIGARFEKEAVGDFVVYHRFVPPCGPGPLRELPRNGWQAAASHHPQDAARALDGRPDTLWESGAPQQSNMTFTVDLGATQTFCQMRIALGSNVTDAPAGFRVEVSGDGAAWSTVQDSSAQGALLFWENGQPRFNVYGDHFTVTFALVQARFVRLTLTEHNPRNWWSIAELRLFAPAAAAGSS